MGLIDLLIAEAFPTLSIDQIEAMDWDTWLQRAAQAEYVLMNFRGMTEVSVDILLGVPPEIVEAERKQAIEEARRVERLRRYGERHRKPGEKGPIDKKQQEMFLHEHGRTKMEALAQDMMGIPQGMINEVDFSFPKDFTDAVYGPQDPGPEGEQR